MSKDSVAPNEGLFCASEKRKPRQKNEWQAEVRVQRHRYHSLMQDSSAQFPMLGIADLARTRTATRHHVAVSRTPSVPQYLYR